MEDAQTNIKESLLDKLKLFIFSKKGLVLATLLLIFLLPAIYLGLPKQTATPKIQSTSLNQPTNTSDKIWQMTLSYNTQSQALILKEIHIDSGTAPASPIETSPYVAEVLDANNQLLFKTHFNLTVDLAYNSYFAPGISSEEAKVSLPPSQKIIEKSLALPFFSQGKTIRILKNDSEMLHFTPPQLTSFSLFSDAYAESSGPSCNPIHIVLISEGYTDFNQFQKDADLVKSSLLSVSPFSDNKGKLDFLTFNNDQSLGCIKGGRLSTECINDGSAFHKLSAAIQKQFPNLPSTDGAVKKVVLVNAQSQRNGTDNYTTGMSVVSGDRSVIAAHIEEPAADIKGDLQAKLYIHEIGGHLIGGLYDRYIYEGLSAEEEHFKLESIGNNHNTNCSINPNGEDFWKTARPIPAGGKNAYPFCTLKSAFGPAEQSAACDLEPNIKNRGNPNSVMSALDCGDENNQNFDKVEQAAITKVLSSFSACAASESNPAANPASGTTPADNSKTGRLICASVAKRFDSDTLTVENKMAEDVNLILQQNYCPYNGHPQKDWDPDCKNKLGTKEVTLKPGQKTAFKMTKLLKCKNNALVINQVITAGPNKGCYRDDIDQPWDGGKAFAVTSNAPKSGEACDADPATSDDPLLKSVTASDVSASGSTSATPGTPGTGGTSGTTPAVNCRPDPNCSPAQKTIHLCQLICSP